MEPLSRVKSTYRVQFSRFFTFKDAMQLSVYLSELGISHVYASPIMESIPGSVHGYDVTDFSRIREELGGKDDFERLNSSLREKGIGWIQDFVPNHMAMDTRNPYIWDILENGRDSTYSKLFDIDWSHPSFGKDKLCWPFLEKPYFRELEAGNFSFGLGNGITLKYKGLEMPVSTLSYETLLGKELSRKARQIFSGRQKSEHGKENGPGIDEEEKTMQEISMRLEISGENLEIMDKVISMQNYSLRYWRSADFEINYRRFFAVNGLICLKEEDSDVFRIVHEKLLSLVMSGRADGIRIDHIDGLYNPGVYLRKLRDQAKNAYIVVEKILEHDESLDEKWPVQGTTGYDFLGRVTTLMCSDADFHTLDKIYREFTGVEGDESDMLYSSKLNSLDSLFPAVLDIVAAAFWKGMRKKPFGRDLTFHGIRSAIREILAHTPVYRTYIADSNHSKRGLTLLNSIIQTSMGFREDLFEYFNAVEMFVNGYTDDSEASNAIQTLQQYMPAILAKSVEDKLFYTYNRLISLNEVGINPFQPQNSISGFHSFNRARMENSPVSMNALSTHDTKLSEDVRARISILSEIPEEWKEIVQSWHITNSRFSSKNNGVICPSRNEEYYIYQLLLGSYPNSEEEERGYRERILTHLVKSIREAGENTNWDKPDKLYERNYTNFVDSLLDKSGNAEFCEYFRDVQSLISHHGFLNSISQKILQMTSPGIPDTYQGTEIWNFNLVDPDNRRSVDFQRIMRLHRTVREEFQHDHSVLSSYLDEYRDGKIKLLVTSLMLNLRRKHPGVFLNGTYEPVFAEGPHRENLVAFYRSFGDMTIIVAVPRLTVSLGKMKMPVGNEVWSGDTITFPDGISGEFRDVFTGRSFYFDPHSSNALGDILVDTPFIVLVSMKNTTPG